jgi:hypothetical protein
LFLPLCFSLCTDLVQFALEFRLVVILVIDIMIAAHTADRTNADDTSSQQSAA